MYVTARESRLDPNEADAKRAKRHNEVTHQSDLLLATYDAWKKRGRQVKEEERAVMIGKAGGIQVYLFDVDQTKSLDECKQDTDYDYYEDVPVDYELQGWGNAD
ncbi:hypothetical protein N9112_00340 [bacterium]|nr:hypothetical protein [bacterium]